MYCASEMDFSCAPLNSNIIYNSPDFYFIF